MAHCLASHIAVWDQCSDKEQGILYVNDLHGFSLRKFEAITNEEKQDAITLINHKIELSAEKVENEIRTYLHSQVRAASVIDKDCIGYIAENKKVKSAVSGKYAGIEIDIPEGEHFSLNIEKIAVFGKTTATTDLLVIDLLTGQTVDTIPIDLVADQANYNFIGKKYGSEKQRLHYLFVIDQGLTDVYSVYSDGTHCHNCGYGIDRLNAWVYGRGVSISQSAEKISRNLSGLGHTNGMILHYSLNCDIKGLVCSYSELFKMAMLYRTGIEVCDEIIYSSRLNTVTTIDKDKAVKLKEQYQAEYANSMKNVLYNIQLPNNICYACEPLISNQVRIP